MVLLGSVGCAKSVQSQEQVHKGVLENVDRKAYGNQWVVLEFKHGMTADIRTAGQSKFYTGHYQEITVDSQGNFLSNLTTRWPKTCKSMFRHKKAPK
jgi:hypothetical protein